MYSDRPMATTRMSARPTTPSRPFVLEWQVVTVAWRHFSICSETHSNGRADHFMFICLPRGGTSGHLTWRLLFIDN